VGSNKGRGTSSPDRIFFSFKIFSTQYPTFDSSINIIVDLATGTYPRLPRS
jgi:hypothetical protein